MSVPALAPVPPLAIRELITGSEWEACLDAWIALAEMRLVLDTAGFEKLASVGDLGQAFLRSYFLESASVQTPNTPKERTLRRLCFALTRRIVLEVWPLSKEVDWPFFALFCRCYAATSSFKNLLSELWQRDRGLLSKTVEKGKELIINQLSTADVLRQSRVEPDVRALTMIALVLPEIGRVLMTGSDFLDTLFETYGKLGGNGYFQSSIAANVYVCLTSLTKTNPPATGLLLDQMFGLKAATNFIKSNPQPTLLSDLVCSTPLLGRLEAAFTDSSAKRGQPLLEWLREYRASCGPYHSRRTKARRRPVKGKSVATDEVHVHRMSLITQIQDLFPDLGSAYLSKLLDHYGENVELVVANILSESLPPKLQRLNPTEDLHAPEHSYLPEPAPIPVEPQQPSKPQPLPPRRNIYDNDELDRLAVPANRLHYGGANPDLTADDLLADRSDATAHAAQKAAIFSALAAFDADEDERDDSYDVADVGGTVDSALPGTDAEADALAADRGQHARSAQAATAAEKNSNIDNVLFAAYEADATQFARAATTRRTPARAALRRATGMTDEAIEGWAIMMARDPRRRERVARAYRDAMLMEGGGALVNGPADAEKDEDEGGDETDKGEKVGGAGGQNRRGGGGGRGRGRGQGRGGWGGGGGGGRGCGQHRGGGGGPPTSSRGRYAHKTSRGTRDRKEGHAKKMARGSAFPGGES